MLAVVLLSTLHDVNLTIDFEAAYIPRSVLLRIVQFVAVNEHESCTVIPSPVLSPIIEFDTVTVAPYITDNPSLPPSCIKQFFIVTVDPVEASIPAFVPPLISTESITIPVFPVTCIPLDTAGITHTALCPVYDLYVTPLDGGTI
jgi:hypothetical protein